MIDEGQLNALQPHVSGPVLRRIHDIKAVVSAFRSQESANEHSRWYSGNELTSLLNNWRAYESNVRELVGFPLNPDKSLRNRIAQVTHIVSGSDVYSSTRSVAETEAREETQLINVSAPKNRVTGKTLLSWLAEANTQRTVGGLVLMSDADAVMQYSAGIRALYKL